MKSSESEYRFSLEKARKHFITITRHKLLVMRYCFKLGLYRQGLLHDLSKYSPAEFLRGARFYQGDRSPNDAERRFLGASEAWMHHKGRNKHHYEYWTDYHTGVYGSYFPPKGTSLMIGCPMPNRYIMEMFCDRIAACKIYAGENFTLDMPLAYFIQKNPRDLIHPDTAKKLEILLRMYAEEGDSCFIKLRKASHRDRFPWERTKEK